MKKNGQRALLWAMAGVRLCKPEPPDNLKRKQMMDTCLDLTFPQEPVMALWRKAWSGDSENWRTEIDDIYEMDSEGGGLPCLLLHVRPYGVWLSVNADVRDDAEVWIDLFNPNHWKDPEALAAAIENLFGKRHLDKPIHLTDSPDSYDTIKLSVDWQTREIYCCWEFKKEVWEAMTKSKDEEDDEEDEEAEDWWK